MSPHIVKIILFSNDAGDLCVISLREKNKEMLIGILEKYIYKRAMYIRT